MEEKLIVSASPHIRAKTTTTNIMLDVIIGLMPAAIASVIIFGFRALMIIADTVLVAVLAEYVSRKVMKRENTVFDLSAVVTGLLLAMNLPVGINPIFAAFGSVVAIVVVKQMFGGIGNNFVNPALAARIILLSSFPSSMTTWAKPFYYKEGAVDAVTTATPLAMNANGQTTPLKDLFLGTTAGCLGETCALALIIGGVYLMIRRVISPVIPFTYIATVAVMSLIFGQDILFQLLSGGLMLGAFFMATDYTTSPINTKGKVVYAIGCGVFTFLIRNFANLPEGVSFSILLMNILVPLIERATNPRPFGEKESKNA